MITTYGKVWFGDQMFVDNFSFYKGYNVPNLKTIEEYRNEIENLILNDTPEVFGLHPNVDKSCQTKESERILESVMSIQTKDICGGIGKIREETMKRLASDLLSK